MSVSSIYRHRECVAATTVISVHLMGFTTGHIHVCVAWKYTALTRLHLPLCFSLFHTRSIRARHRVQEGAMWWSNNILFAASDGRHERSWWNFLTKPDYKILCKVEPKRRHYVRRTAAPFSPSVFPAARYKLSNRRTLRERIFLLVNKSVHMSCKNDTCNWNKVAK